MTQNLYTLLRSFEYCCAISGVSKLLNAWNTHVECLSGGVGCLTPLLAAGGFLQAKFTEHPNVVAQCFTKNRNLKISLSGKRYDHFSGTSFWTAIGKGDKSDDVQM